MRLRRDVVLVRLAPRADRTASGILMAESLPSPVHMGKVIQTGDAVTEVAVGDVIAFPPEVGDDVSGLFPVPHLLLRETEIAAVLEKV